MYTKRVTWGWSERRGDKSRSILRVRQFTANQLRDDTFLLEHLKHRSCDILSVEQQNREMLPNLGRGHQRGVHACTDR